MQRARHETTPLNELADRLALRELVDAYARCADRRDVEGQLALFEEDAQVHVYMDGEGHPSTDEYCGREKFRPVLENLSTYAATTHFNGQSTVSFEENDQARGETYCLAHHVKVSGERRQLMIASLRYHDRFVKHDGQWYFRLRKLFVDWIDQRELD